ncbi:hypothetical protein FRZ67_05465 [Panacibacter ginsenosidivorans]|uniref:Uncharacterized protein n=1 Tax=Panacibacter ginsenosidivorans TaxID=1813871 RepID=A0A5B8V5N0_9BACT|nr:hypothetical protein [Panacibacter ginsenosidivorans]QEC66777.1 hypothetical protein FRZ67_05465 [Panacibacter ginsenosidivorans]
MTYTNASNLSVEHGVWLGSLDFYEKELDILENRLAEVAEKNTDAEAKAGIEHFQNQFIVQRNNIGELKHTVNEHAHLVFEDAKHHAGHVEQARVDDHKKIDDAVKTFEKVIKDLRHEFNTFLSKWM